MVAMVVRDRGSVDPYDAYFSNFLTFCLPEVVRGRCRLSVRSTRAKSLRQHRYLREAVNRECLQQQWRGCRPVHLHGGAPRQMRIPVVMTCHNVQDANAPQLRWRGVVDLECCQRTDHRVAGVVTHVCNPCMSAITRGAVDFGVCDPNRQPIEQIADPIAELWINHDCYDMCSVCHASSH
jgi:hypothetical protein